MIRALRFYDLPAVSRLIGDPLAGCVGVVDASTDLTTGSLAAACLPVATLRHPRRRIFVDVGGLHVRGLVHLVRRPGGLRWEIVHLGHSGVGDVAEECTGLLEFACAWAATDGATKITARVRDDDDRLCLLQEVGFR